MRTATRAAALLCLAFGCITKAKLDNQHYGRAEELQQGLLYDDFTDHHTVSVRWKT